MPIAWTPPGSEMGLGSVLLPARPLKSLTRQDYKFALADRIDRLVAKEEPETARRLLAKVEEMDLLSPPKNLKGVGELLVENSEWLRSRAGIPSGPVPRSEIRDEPETRAALEAETLEEFLSAVYLEHETM